jgi:hypothetical protein
MPAHIPSNSDNEIAPLRAQQRSRQEILSRNFDVQFATAKVAQLSAALPIREQFHRAVSAPDNKHIDALTEWSRRERDRLAFEPGP